MWKHFWRILGLPLWRNFSILWLFFLQTIYQKLCCFTFHSPTCTTTNSISKHTDEIYFVVILHSTVEHFLFFSPILCLLNRHITDVKGWWIRLVFYHLSTMEVEVSLSWNLLSSGSVFLHQLALTQMIRSWKWVLLCGSESWFNVCPWNVHVLTYCKSKPACFTANSACISSDVKFDSMCDKKDFICVCEQGDVAGI